MLRRAIVLAGLFAAVGSAPALAQVQVEASATFGWSFSDGVSGDPWVTPTGIYDRIDPQDGATFTLMGAVLPTDNFEVGFIFGRQSSVLLADGTNEREVGDLSISNYHGYFGYNFGDPDSKLRPYLLFGAGATNYGSVDYTTAGGLNGSTQGNAQFSTTWGAGVKYYPAPSVGVRFGARWTPTYIKSDAAGWWCDPYWGCYLVGSAQYSNQFELGGGIVFRF
jgi:hypothetical protein